MHIAKQASEDSWVKALAAQTLAKRAEAKADMSGTPDDVKVATELGMHTCFDDVRQKHFPLSNDQTLHLPVERVCRR